MNGRKTARMKYAECLGAIQVEPDVEDGSNQYWSGVESKKIFFGLRISHAVSIRPPIFFYHIYIRYEVDLLQILKFL